MIKPILATLFFPFFATAQTYVPFINTTDSSDRWVDVNSCNDFSCYESYFMRYTIQGDTTIGGQTYANIYQSKLEKHGPVASQWCTNTSTFYPSYSYCGLREEQKKVYVINYYSGDPEYMAYDFNLSVGDTVPCPNNGQTNPNERIIVSIDSVMVFGSYRKRYMLESNMGVARFIIEGIGASTGALGPLDIVNPSYCANNISCYSEYGVSDYFTAGCEMMLMGVDELYPEKQEAKLVRIVDSMGRKSQDEANTLLIYMYSDGTAKKIFRVE